MSQAVRDQTFNVRDFGAVGDNVTDDAEAVQKTFDAAGEAGTVYFPPGTYKVSKPVKS